MTLNLNVEIFVIHMVALKIIILADLLTKISILTKNSKYADIFLPKFTAEFLEHCNNNHIILLKKINNHFMT